MFNSYNAKLELLLWLYLQLQSVCLLFGYNFTVFGYNLNFIVFGYKLL